jgi:hypothetical protein
MQTRVLLDVPSEFELMVKYQRILESEAVVIEHAPQDAHQYGLYTVLKPYPTYEEYMLGNDFIEDKLIMSWSDLVQLEALQDKLRKEKAPSHGTPADGEDSGALEVETKQQH